MKNIVIWVILGCLQEEETIEKGYLIQLILCLLRVCLSLCFSGRNCANQKERGSIYRKDELLSFLTGIFLDIYLYISQLSLFCFSSFYPLVLFLSSCSCQKFVIGSYISATFVWVFLHLIAWAVDDTCSIQSWIFWWTICSMWNTSLLFILCCHHLCKLYRLLNLLYRLASDFFIIILTWQAICLLQITAEIRGTTPRSLNVVL